jgi:tetratricopeptide (TPR) repeat protein
MFVRKFAAMSLVLSWVMSSFFVASVAISQEKPPIAEESASLSPVNLPRGELDAERIASLTKAIEAIAEQKLQAKLLTMRAKQYMRAQDWNKAAADYRKAADIQPQNSMHWMRGAILLRLAKNRMHYDQLANEMLKHFKDTTNTYQAERTAKMCWLPVPPVDERELAEKLAELAVARRTRDWGEYYPSTRALGYYRYKQFDNALKAIAESDRLNAARRKKQVDLDTINRIVEAMCLARLGHNKDAVAKLNAAGDVLQKNVADAEVLYGGDFWNDWLLAKVLHDEARTLLLTPTEESGDLTPEERYNTHVERESQHLENLKEETEKRQRELEVLKGEVLRFRTALESGEKTVDFGDDVLSREEAIAGLTTRFKQYKNVETVASWLDRIYRHRSTQLEAVRNYARELAPENAPAAIEALQRLQDQLKHIDSVENLLKKGELPDPVMLKTVMLKSGSIEFRIDK